MSWEKIRRSGGKKKGVIWLWQLNISRMSDGGKWDHISYFTCSNSYYYPFNFDILLFRINIILFNSLRTLTCFCVSVRQFFTGNPTSIEKRKTVLFEVFWIHLRFSRKHKFFGYWYYCMCSRHYLSVNQTVSNSLRSRLASYCLCTLSIIFTWLRDVITVCNPCKKSKTIFFEISKSKYFEISNNKKKKKLI